jgi:hypothetical protein
MERIMKDFGDEKPGLAGADNPGQRSGEGSSSVLEQMHKDQQRNSNDGKTEREELPQPVRDSTA